MEWNWGNATDCGLDPYVCAFEAFERVEKVDRRCFEYEGARCIGTWAFGGGEVTSGGRVVRFGFGDGEGAGSKLVGEGDGMGFVGWGDSTVAMLCFEYCV